MAGQSLDISGECRRHLPIAEVPRARGLEVNLNVLASPVIPPPQDLIQYAVKLQWIRRGAISSAVHAKTIPSLGIVNGQAKCQLSRNSALGTTWNYCGLRVIIDKQHQDGVPQWCGDMSSGSSLYRSVPRAVQLSRQVEAPGGSPTTGQLAYLSRLRHPAGGVGRR
ncbi:hypothetical protein GLOTRDRAFT_94800 [Gloeophyllum trabeum ATCC 11539]|uniref:Uncharacterized protein n=1 Tax=Gloeophyllum trabeum (strain ATCC 11539 / FP-39264 / Madison 617) TaxID=670483 RepID=S7RLN3_GLOTA|nr:uncharacterized protein GLOTRDRAFT_94800 [Gloeophyllum trabeum ATCC 11539]EPQ53589.1 hypothetical protein GLOTRDRAFT_94800 [Gloeophyllum trabeum ATCC 11539]